MILRTCIIIYLSLLQVLTIGLRIIFQLEHVILLVLVADVVVSGGKLINS